MMELIDRDALLKLAQRKCGKLCSMCDFALDDDSWCDAEVFGVDIRRQPTVAAKPVVYGKWIPTFHEYANKYERCMIADEFHCSECGVYSHDKFNYCPNCGADMRGDTDARN